MAQNSVGCFYYNGKGVEINYEEAVFWFEQAASSNFSEALYNLGVCYFTGNGKSKDMNKAFWLWNDAAKQGHENAYKNLLKCHNQGLC
jgi:TPR repeat protein